jgi:hypothetical protein
MQPLDLLIEAPAGLASLSRYVEHGESPPPMTRPGRKWGYRVALARIMGLRPRQRARAYIWAEADGGVASLLAAYTQPGVMRQVAEIIRGWKLCPYGPHPPDPSCSRCSGTGSWNARDLWEVLLREPRCDVWKDAPSRAESSGGGGDITIRRIKQRSTRWR